MNRVLTAVGLFCLIVLSASLANGQPPCSRSVVVIEVFDSAVKPISQVTFEPLGVIPDDKFKELSTTYGTEGYRRNFALPTAAGESLAKTKLGELPATDACGKPLKQTSIGPAAENDKFGVCMDWRSTLGEILVKVSAPGFEPRYFVNDVFRGCSRHAGYTLYRPGEKHDKDP